MNDSPTLTIRGQRSDDGSELYSLWSDEALLRNSLEIPYLAEDTFREQFNTTAPNVHVLIAEMSSLSGRKQIVGAAQLRANQRPRQRHTGELVLLIRTEQRGSEAESMLLDKTLDLAGNWLGLRRIEVIVFTDNEPAITLFEQHGFAREAVMRRYALRDGTYGDAILLAHVRGTL
jgi:putative acetyltransferase